MADIKPTIGKAEVYGKSFVTATHLLATGTPGTINGDWITPCSGLAWTGLLIRYEENGGATMLDADIQIQVKYPGDAIEYTLRDQGNVIFEITALTGADVAFWQDIGGVDAGDRSFDLRGISHIRAVVITTGSTHVAGDVVDVTFLGHFAGSRI